MPAAQKVSKKAQSLSPIDLAWDSFEESTSSTSFVTPSVKKVAKRPVTMSSNVVLSENNGNNNKTIYVACCRKKRKLVPLPASQSSKVQVIEQVKTFQRQATLASIGMPKSSTWKLIVKTCQRQATLATIVGMPKSLMMATALIVARQLWMAALSMPKNSSWMSHPLSTFNR
jgi:hypothetical protein